MMKIYKQVSDYRKAAKKVLKKEVWSVLEGAAGKGQTHKKNIDDWSKIQIRPRRLVDVSTIDTSTELFGQPLPHPILLSPLGFQHAYHKKAEKEVIEASNKDMFQVILSTLSHFTYPELAKMSTVKPWFQLYPTQNREWTRQLLSNAENAGAKILVLTVDTPDLGMRNYLYKDPDSHKKLRQRAGNLMPFGQGIVPQDPSMDWNMISWIRENTSMKVILKGIVTREDTLLALDREVDGIIVSNHGGRQLDSNLSTVECLPEVVQAVKGQIPILIDGGIRTGGDVFKALSMGADAVCVGRPYIYGLAVDGTQGVRQVLKMLQNELIHTMKLAGTPGISKIGLTHTKHPF